jgi:diaminohydroxyphosphoribosylaminopyrimidine deaminase / 5-amino-6-(5-phosphoribosylamino)uracil reductase
LKAQNLSDESYIQLTLELAKKGMGKVSPNPLVGSVIVLNDKIIGAGFHEKAGEEHAEVNAIKYAKGSVEGATLYVNLEPCSHFGKTPPCVNFIIEKKIKRVVVGTLDMNPLVSGRGVQKLKEAGIDVKVGVLEKECIQLNKFFFKYISQKIPYITLKAAQTLDGKIADKKGYSKWITCKQSRNYVHELRSNYDAVMVGANTVKKDNPSLTVRFVEGRDPKRVVVDYDLSLKLTYKIFNNKNGNQVYVVTSKAALEKKKTKIRKMNALGIEVIAVKEEGERKLDMLQVFKELGKREISSVLIEGGSMLFSTVIRKKTFDDVVIFLSPKILGKGIPVVEEIGVNSITNAFKLNITSVEQTGEDILIHLEKQ